VKYDLLTEHERRKLRRALVENFRERLHEIEREHYERELQWRIANHHGDEARKAQMRDQQAMLDGTYEDVRTRLAEAEE
jgi:hypothetical protein